MNARRGLQMILAAVVFAAIVPMVSGGVAQSWHLLDVDYTGMDAVDGTTHHYRDLFMNKTGNATGSHMKLPNVTENTTWWYAECPAQFDGIAFGGGDWVVNIDHGPTDYCTIWANVCKVNDSTGEVTYLANGSVTTADTRASVIVCYDLPQTNQVFNTSERLALRMYHNRSNDLRIYYYDVEDDKYSNLTSPVSDPGYPIPEPATLVLISIGLMMLICIASFKRLKNE